MAQPVPVSLRLPSSTQILISGAGPVGLAAAVELGQRGIECLIIEPRTTVSRARPRCKTVNVRTMEHLRRWGIAGRLRSAAPLAPAWSQDVIFCSSLTGRELSRFTGVFGLSADPDRCPEVGQQAPQFVLEEVLREVVEELPTCTLALGSRVIGLDQSDAAVRVAVDTGDSQVEIEAEYVIGCDGGRSIVREAIGAQYVGDVSLRPNFGVVIRAPELWKNVPHGPAVQYWIVNERAPAVFGPLDGGPLWWGAFLGVDRERGEREIADLAAAAIGREMPIEVLSTDPWTAHMEIVDTSRQGRVFLAGDAAHLNPPWGGHGMNTGFGDAVDLGWKLAAVLEGWGGPTLLDSYELERRPVQMQIIEEASANMSVLSNDLLSNDIDDEGQAGHEARQRLDKRIQETKTREFHSLDLVLGLGYEHSPVVIPGTTGTVSDPRRARPGFRLPHTWLAPDLAVFDLIGPGLTLLNANGDPSATAAFETACHERRIPTTVVDVAALPLERSYQPGLILVRPDQHVTWAGEHWPEPIGDLLDVVRGVMPAETDSRQPGAEIEFALEPDRA
jgi:2-polyprenyl-6-methoxyphenol hydroxylase-like FAD-dependent oxidoreductase